MNGIWRHTPLDSTLFGLSVVQFVTALALASAWEASSAGARVGTFALVIFMTVYNIVVISHVFTHQAWFWSPTMNRLVSMLNSVNIGQSVQVYQFAHVRNHHRYNNDRKGPDGTTKDLSSTFRLGRGDDHTALFRYAVGGAVETLVKAGRGLLAVTRWWRVGRREVELLELAAAGPGRHVGELRQVQLDRLASFVSLGVFTAVSWHWTLFCYIPALFVAFALVNVQNYYEHYGAAPASRYANSVSHYGRLYNLLAFNDGYHQEHHLRPQAHWSRLPQVRRDHADQPAGGGRIVSPLPAILGFLDRTRPQLTTVPLPAQHLEGVSSVAGAPQT